MFKKNIACCYHPTTVVFIDDNRSFLDSILLELNENINTISFTKPTKAIEYLKEHSVPTCADRYLRSLKDTDGFDGFDSGNVEHGYVDIDIFSIHKEIYDPNRFQDSIVVVVDYTMPEMNGLDLCKALEEYPFKFVLLTGDATLSNTIEAFNAGLIHQFISKSSSHFMDELQNSIYNLQDRQFEEFSDVIIKNLSASRSIGLTDPVLVEFLKGFFKDSEIAEYYLLNESGCFLMADIAGNISWMVVKNENEMAEYTNIAIDSYGDEDVVNSLRSREKILFIHTEEEHINITVDEWRNRLYPATKLVGKNNTYYYSHVKQDLNKGVVLDKIISYEQFLSER